MSQSNKSKKLSSRPNPPVGPTRDMNNLCFVLLIKTSNTAPQCGVLLNRFEEANSILLGIKHTPITRYNKNIQEHEVLTKDELEQPGFWGDTMIMKSENTKKTFRNSKGYFTIKEVAKKIVKFEISSVCGRSLREQGPLN